MDKPVVVLLLVLFAVIALFLFGLTHITGLFIGFGPPAEVYEWWNVSWTYRVGLGVNTTSYDRTDWPVEHIINFTDLIPSGTFDENSIRVIEYDSSGNVVQHLKSQFDKSPSYDAASNAAGELVFIMNGTAAANTKKMFFIYYGTTEQGSKEAPNYATDLKYDFDIASGEFNVNNSMLAYYVDSTRGENASGIVRVKGILSNNDIFDWTPALPATSRPYEYAEFSNGTHNFTFNFTNNATLKANGTVRMIIEQRGDEMIWNSETLTNEGYGVKQYIFYDDLRWVKVITNFTNLAGSSITRNSTFAGALGIDAARAFGSGWQSGFGNTTPPGWWYASDQFSSFHAGIIHINQSGTTNFWVPDSTGGEKIGIHLNSTTINSGASIIATAAIDLNDTYGDYTQVRDMRYRMGSPVIVTLDLPEYWYMIIDASTNASAYNRNESVLIIGNISADDPYNITQYMNVTLDMGTAGTGDDTTIQLFDDGAHGDYVAGDKIWGNIYNLSNAADVNSWVLNYTAYSQDYDLLNQSTHTIYVTDIFNLTVNIINDKPIAGTTVYGNVYVRNYREDYWVIGAFVNCSYDSTEISNIEDLLNGTYSVNFTAPMDEATYTLVCNATQNGNFGEANDSFNSEPDKINVTIYSIPPDPVVSNVELYRNGSFVLTSNATSIKNGTAYAANVSLELLPGWEDNTTGSQSCGDIEKFTSCYKGFNVTVPNNTSPGNYYINLTVTWRNPDTTIDTNRTEINVTVQDVPQVDVQEPDVSGDVADGTSIVMNNFTILSVGNIELRNITFECVSGDVCSNFAVDFEPDNVSSIAVSSSESVSINITVPFEYAPGTYNGTVNVSAKNITAGYDDSDVFIIFATVPSKTNVSITPSIPSYTTTNVTQTDNETFAFHVNLTVFNNGSARWVNISLTYDPGWSANSTFETCGNLTSGGLCTHHFNVTVPKITTPGDYYVYFRANWTDNDGSLGTNTSSLLVTVASHPLLAINESEVSGDALDGTSTIVTNFTVMSAGNAQLQNVGFNCSWGEACENFTFFFNPASVSAIAAGINATVFVNASVPVGFPAGTYNGTLNVSSTNGGEKNLTVFVNVLDNLTWSVTPTVCEKSQQQPTGLACNVNVSNLGNTIMSFNITPDDINYTQVNDTDFNIEKGNWHVFAINYDVSGAPFGTYNATYLLDANQSGANPDNVSIDVTIIPSVPPLINHSLVPNETHQNDTVTLRINVTDRSGSGVPWVKVNVSRPEGYVDELHMYLLSTDGNLTMWELAYPNSTNETNGSTYVTGIYNISVFTKDNIGNENSENLTLIIYTDLDIAMSTLTNTYYQGDTASVYYIARDIDGSAVDNVTASFTVYDSQGNISYLSGNMTSNEYGTISPLPSFGIPSDSPLGTYTIRSYSTYFDAAANRIIEVEKNNTFEVLSRTVTVTGIFADIETTVVWYPNNVMKFAILVYNGEGRPVDPTTMNLTVYDPADNQYFTVHMEGVNNFTKEAIGYFKYNHAMGATSATGMYLAVLNVTQDTFETMKLKAFRVAQGGPYDVRLQLLESEVPRGSLLDYQVIVENKGEVSQDVFIEYWVSTMDQGTTYSSWSEAVLTPALTNQSFTRNIDIPSTQPMGTYLLNARVTWDPVQTPILVNRSFVVTSEITPPTTIITYGGVSPYVTAAAPTPTAPLIAGLMISKYNNNISLARDVTILESIVVNNTGQTSLNNVSLFLVGVPVSWYNITPVSYRTLSEGSSTVFVITMRAPRNAEVTMYRASLIATSGVVSDTKNIEVSVFRSFEDLLREEIRKIRSELHDLEVDTKVAEIEKKDTTNVELLIDEIKVQLGFAEDYIEEGDLEQASSNIANAKNLLEKAKDALDRLEVIKVKGFILPLWAIILILVGTAVGVFVVLYFRRKKVEKILRPWIVPFGKLADAVKIKKAPAEDMAKEKEKIERMLKVLEKERKEEIISVGAYREMKKSLEKKLERVKKKIK